MDRSYESLSYTQIALRKHRPQGQPKLIALSFDNITSVIIPMQQKSKALPKSSSAAKTTSRVNSCTHIRSKVSPQTASNEPGFAAFRQVAWIDRVIRHRRSRSYQQLSYKIRQIDYLFKNKGLSEQILVKPVKPSNFIPSKAQSELKQAKHNGFDNCKPSSTGLRTGAKLGQSGKDVVPGCCSLDPQSKCSLAATRCSHNKKIRLKTCEDKQLKAGQKYNIIWKPQLVGSMISKKGGRSDYQIKTQHCSPDNQKIPVQSNHSFSILQFALTQQSVFEKGIPGIKFKQQSPDHFQQTSLELHPQLKSPLIAASDYLHQDELLEDDHDGSISKLFQLRSNNKLGICPKQWHFFNFLKLSQLSLYRTNLGVSCDHWVVIDELQLKYLRGWHPKAIRQFSVVTKLLLAFLLLELQAFHNLDFKAVRLRINNFSISNKVENSSLVLSDSCFTLRNNTIISLKDLFIGVLGSAKQDLSWHLIYAVSHIYKRLRLPIEQDVHGLQLAKPIEIKSQKEEVRYLQQVFMEKSREVCQRLGLHATRIASKRKKMPTVRNGRHLEAFTELDSVLRQTNDCQYILAESNCIEASILFLSCLGHQTFVQALTEASASYQAQIRYQVGYNFWESRTFTFRNECPHFRSNQFAAVSSRNPSSGDYSTIAFHLGDRIAVVCGDSKTNMTFRDVRAIHGWMRQTFKRFQANKGVSREVRAQ